MDYQYWLFVESHPAHAPLPSDAASDAIGFLNWSYRSKQSNPSRLLIVLTDIGLEHFIPSSTPLPPFTQEACQDLLRSLDGKSRGA
jgi:hypothetical protein